MLTRQPSSSVDLATRLRGLLGDDRVVTGLITAVVVAAVLGLFNMTWYVTVGLVGPTLLIIAVVLISMALVRSAAKVSDIPRFVRLAAFGVAAKMVGTFARYFVNNNVYDRGDEQVYHPSAVELGHRIHDGVWSLQGTLIEPFGTQTQSVSWVLGSVYSVAGGSQLLGYSFFSWLSWVGVVLLYRAFRVAVPDVDSKPYALLMFFLPSVLYWPSTIGKDAIMILCIGVVTTGLARLLAGGGVVRAVACILGGVTGLVWVRPHMALILLAATMPAMLVRAPVRAGRRQQAGRVVMLGAMGLLLLGVVGNVDAFFGGSSEGGWYKRGTSQAENQSTTGGSNFVPEPVRSPADLPRGVVNVVLRPLPWQATGGTALIASMEGLVLVGLFARRWRLVFYAPKVFFARPAVAFALTYCVLFIVAFSNIGNAGILARQRTQMLPFLIFALCVIWADARPHLERRSLRVSPFADRGAPARDEDDGPDEADDTETDDTGAEAAVIRPA